MKSLLATILVIIGVTCLEDNKGSAGVQKSDQLNMNWPQGGPLSLKERTGTSKVAKREAEEIARDYLKIKREQPLKLYPAYLTDTDYPFLQPKDLPIWLVEIHDYRLHSPRNANQQPSSLPVFYVAINAENGRLLEGFTPPRKAWWRKLPNSGVEHEDYLKKTGRVITWSEEQKPRITLPEALSSIRQDDSAAQIIIRYALYSNQSSGALVVERIDGLSIVPKTVQRNVWMIFSEGLEFYPSSPAVLSAGPGENISVFVIYGRNLVVVDASTGHIIENEDHGDVGESIDQGDVAGNIAK